MNVWCVLQTGRHRGFYTTGPIRRPPCQFTGSHSSSGTIDHFVEYLFVDILILSNLMCKQYQQLQHIQAQQEQAAAGGLTLTLHHQTTVCV